MQTSIWERPWIDALLIGLAAFALAAIVGVVGGIRLPEVHDEFAYLFMADTFAKGRLTNPTPPFWHHLETFHVLLTPTYMGKYPPAQGLMLAIGVLVGHPMVGVWLSCGLMAAAVTWMLRPWLGRRWALAGGAFVVLNLGMAHSWAQTYWGGAVAAAGGALVFGSLRRASDHPHWSQGLIMGIGLLVLANSRPFEGLLVSLPAIGAVLTYMAGSRFSARERVLLLVTLILAVSVGFFAMGAYNHAVTGSAFRFPYQEYQSQYSVAPSLLLGNLREHVPLYRHAEFRDFWVGWDANRHSFLAAPFPYLLTHVAALLAVLQAFLGPQALGLFFAKPILGDRVARVVLGGMLLALGGSLLSKADYVHYLAPLVGPLMLFALFGLRRLSRTRGLLISGKWFLLALVGLSFWLPGKQVYRHWGLSGNPLQERRVELAECLDSLPFKNLVLVEYSGSWVHRGEWVRNGPDPFEAKTVWARSMGPSRDRAIVDGNRDRAIWIVRPEGIPGEGEQRYAELRRPPDGWPAGPSEIMPTCR